MSRPAFPEDVESEIAAGRLWRAKEILQGRLGGQKFEVARYEQYGWVLLQMGDLLEAGKFLLIGGGVDAAYEPALELFRRRNGSRHWRSIVGQFPAAVQAVPPSALPEATRSFLIERGLPADELERPLRSSARGTPDRPRRSSAANWIRAVGCVLVLFLLALLLRAAWLGLGVMYDRALRGGPGCGFPRGGGAARIEA